MRRGLLAANINVNVRYTIEPADGATSTIRELDLTIQMPGLLRLAKPLVLFAFRKENKRILAELKHYVEAAA